MCVGVSVWLVGVVSMWQAEAQLQPAGVRFKFTTLFTTMVRNLVFKQAQRLSMPELV